jgi:hypothetical protein
MSKKRKTREQKIILQLKRKLAQQALYRPVTGQAAKTSPPSIKFEPSQEAISKPAKIEPEKAPAIKKPDISIFSYDPGLIKKDLLKTLILTLIILSLEVVLYLKLR